MSTVSPKLTNGGFKSALGGEYQRTSWITVGPDSRVESALHRPANPLGDA